MAQAGLRHPLKKLYVTNSEVFPLVEWDNKAGILELHFLMNPFAAITLDRQHATLPMGGEMYMKLCHLKATTLRNRANKGNQDESSMVIYSFHSI